jgi:hypothetical protein
MMCIRSSCKAGRRRGVAGMVFAFKVLAKADLVDP